MHYDIIIIGSGSAGGILASRLSEDPVRSVLLLEAGPDYPDFETWPEELKYGFGTSSGILSSSHDWGHTGLGSDQSKPQHIPRGRVIGGSSSVNAQIFLHGLPEDYDGWAAAGNDAWSFELVQPYLQKLETDLDFDQDYHGQEGFIQVGRYAKETWQPDQAAFYEACLVAGYEDCPDHNKPYSTGVGPFPLNVINRVRQSTALTYLHRARNRPNLTIQANSFVQRIVFEGRRAIGVEVEQGGQVTRIEGGEILVSSGSINAPQLLMLSGLGPASHLTDFDIPVVADIPGVGQNLRDHPTVPLIWLAPPGYGHTQIVHWHQVGLRYTAHESHLPNDMIVYIGYNTKEQYLFIRPTINLAMSAGQLTLQSNDPYAHPHLHFHYYEDPFDRQRIQEAIRLIMRLVEHKAFNPIIETRVQPTDEDLATDQALDDWISRNPATGHHAAGTCKMGPASDPLAVVDQQGRVHGIEGLRVADASIMPDCVRANINAATMMIGERIADFIR